MQHLVLQVAAHQEVPRPQFPVALAGGFAGLRQQQDDGGVHAVALRQSQQVVGFRCLGQHHRIHAAVQQCVYGSVQGGCLRRPEAARHGALQGSLNNQVVTLVLGDY